MYEQARAIFAQPRVGGEQTREGLRQHRVVGPVSHDGN